MLLLVGLGNPGARHAGNRHNIGFMAVEAIAKRHGIAPWRRRFQGMAAEGNIGSARVLLLMPGTFMNESGRAVAEAAKFYKVGLDRIVVFHDELDLPAGKLRLKVGGGNAGHNGLRSITAHMGNDYKRARMGIGHPGHRDLVHSYVLGDFAKADKTWLDPLVDAIADNFGLLVTDKSALFLNRVHEAVAPPKPERPAKPALVRNTEKD